MKNHKHIYSLLAGTLPAFFVLFFLCAPLARAEMPGPAPRPPHKPTTVSPWVKRELGQEYLTGNWSGMRDTLADKGVTFNCTFVCDVLGNPVGGREQAVSYDHSMGLDMNVDLEKAANIQGLQFHASCLWRAGANLSKYIGNRFPPSSIYGSEEFKWYALYLEQDLFNKRFNFRIGRFTPGDDFGCSPLYWVFVTNSIDGNPISLPINMPFLTYPNATWGARARLFLTEEVYATTGIFDGDPQVGRDSMHGFDFGLKVNRGLIYLQEFAYAPNTGEGAQGMPGHYKVGAFYHSGKFNNLYQDRNGGSYVVTGLPQKNRIGNYGCYIHGDQMIYREGGPGTDQGLTVMAVCTLAPPELNTFPVFFDCGLIYKGLIPTRDKDIAGVGLAYGKWSGDIARSQRDDIDYNRRDIGIQTYELVLDFNYKVQITDWFFVQPDIQYIVNCNGTGKVPNAMVIGSRFGFTF
jgi:porin